MSDITASSDYVEKSAPSAPNLRWYIVQAYSGKEMAASRKIQENIAVSEITYKFGRVLVPTEEVVETRGGQRHIAERRIFPGYIFLEMDLSDDSWHLVAASQFVSGFVGGTRERPAPVPERDVRAVFAQMKDGVEKPRHKIEFQVGETVHIKEGPFEGFDASIEVVNYERSKLRLSVMIFGRATPVELEFSQVEKR
jgi:transcription termination/antitermination protein NusG